MLHTYEFWFVVGSQFLYGPEVLETVAARAAEMADKLNASGNLPCKIVYKVTAKTNAEISDVVREANYDKHCAGIITWCHTFSPSKMWINGFANLQKPYCHFATQYNREIPNEEFAAHIYAVIQRPQVQHIVKHIITRQDQAACRHRAHCARLTQAHVIVKERRAVVLCPAMQPQCVGHHI